MMCLTTCRFKRPVRLLFAAAVLAGMQMTAAGCALLQPAGGVHSREESPAQDMRDWDEDGITDHEDNCPWHNNPQQSDCDNDGAGDACDMDIFFDGR